MWRLGRRLRRLPWRWIIVAALAVSAFVLGMIGFRTQAAGAGEARTLWDNAYLSLQLFALESGAVDPPVPITLQIARFVAPLSAAYAVVNAVLALLSVQVQRVYLRLVGGHVVVCGLGRKGVRLVQQLCEAGERVVVVEADADNEDLAQCRALGAVVVVGDASSEWSLRRALVDRAGILISALGDDGQNVETAVRAHEANRRRRHGSLRCIIHIADRRLRSLLRQHMLFVDADDPFELEFFNVYEEGARVMLREGPELVSLSFDGKAPHLLIIGLGQLGEALLWRAVRDWRIDRPHASQRMKVTVVDSQAEMRQRQVAQQQPALAEGVDLRFLTLDVTDPQFALGDVFDDNDPPVSVAYCCLDDDPLAMSVALTLRRNLNVPIVVRMSEEAGLATLLDAGARDKPLIEGVRAVGLTDVACSLSTVFGGARETLAHAVHQAYLAHEAARGQTPETNPSMLPWSRLPEELRESNRRQADRIRQELTALGFEIVPTDDLDAPLCQLTPEEIEYLAKREHERWVRERREAGWTPGPEKNVQRRVSPYLVDWDELDESVRDKDRNAVKQWPAVLAKADFCLRRTGHHVQEPTAHPATGSATEMSTRPRPLQTG